MSDVEEREQALAGSMVRASTLVLVGTVARVGLKFLLQLIIIRYLSRSEFGLFSLALAVANILAILSQLGFSASLPGYVTGLLTTGNRREAHAALRTALLVTLSLSTLSGAALFAGSDTVARLLNKPELAPVLLFFALAVPLKALVDVFESQLRSMEIVAGKILFRDLFQPTVAILLVGGSILLAPSFALVNAMFVGSFLLTVSAMYLYARPRVARVISPPAGGPGEPGAAPRPGLSRGAVAYALPMLGAGLAAQMLLWADTLMLGWLSTAAQVGLYNGALRMGGLLVIVLTSICFMYLPLATRLHAQEDIPGLNRLYGAATKWGFIFTLPLFLGLFAAPELLMSIAFGHEYAEAGTALRFISLAFLLHVLAGPNAQTALAAGRPGINFKVLLGTLALNLVGDALLIPVLGIMGAAVSTCVCMLFSNALISWIVYRIKEAHPMTTAYIRLVLVALAAAAALAVLEDQVFAPMHLGVFLHLAILAVAVALAMTLTLFGSGGFDMADARFFAMLERKATGGTRLTRRLFKNLPHPEQGGPEMPGMPGGPAGTDA